MWGSAIVILLLADRPPLPGSSPAEHWRHLRTTNPIESTFATVRLRTRKTKGTGSRIACLTMGLQAGNLGSEAMEGTQRSQVDRRRHRRRHLRGWDQEIRRLSDGSYTTLDNISVQAIAALSRVRTRDATLELCSVCDPPWPDILLTRSILRKTRRFPRKYTTGRLALFWCARLRYKSGAHTIRYPPCFSSRA